MTIRHKTRRFPSPVFWIPAIQLVVTLLLTAAGFLLGGQSAVSLWLGGMIAVVGSVVFIWRFFRQANTQSAQDMLKNAYQGAFSKLLLTALLFGLVLSVYENVKVLLLLAGFVTAQGVNWLAPFIFKRRTLG